MQLASNWRQGGGFKRCTKSGTFAIYCNVQFGISAAIFSACSNYIFYEIEMFGVYFPPYNFGRFFRKCPKRKANLS